MVCDINLGVWGGCLGLPSIYSEDTICTLQPCSREDETEKGVWGLFGFNQLFRILSLKKFQIFYFGKGWRIFIKRCNMIRQT
jgi:hypothetical protein